LFRASEVSGRHRATEPLEAAGDPLDDETAVLIGRLSYEKLPIPDTDRQTLAVYHAEPGSRSAQALALLATAHAAEREPLRSFETD
jgi:hypothetical protein